MIHCIILLNNKNKSSSLNVKLTKLFFKQEVNKYFKEALNREHVLYLKIRYGEINLCFLTISETIYSKR